jgi:hypothetical protein
MTPWRNGSASDSRPEGCVFKSRRGHCFSFCPRTKSPTLIAFMDGFADFWTALPGNSSLRTEAKSARLQSTCETGFKFGSSPLLACPQMKRRARAVLTSNWGWNGCNNPTQLERLTLDHSIFSFHCAGAAFNEPSSTGCNVPPQSTIPGHCDPWPSDKR